MRDLDELELELNGIDRVLADLEATPTPAIAPRPEAAPPTPWQ